jgi:hypothetical protein
VTADAILPATEPIDMIALMHAQQEVAAKPDARDNPREWHRRGLLAPTELDAIVTARVNNLPTIASRAPATSDELTAPDEPTYGDFLREPTA